MTKANSTFLYLLGAIGLFQLADGLITYYVVTIGWAREINPLLSNLAHDAAYPFLKITGAFVCVALLWLVSKKYRMLAVIAAAIIVVFYACVLGWNMHSLLTL